MNESIFKTEMARTAAATRSTIDELTLAAYWEEFKNWEDYLFIGALDSCRRSLKRFPTVSDVIEFRPPPAKEYRWGDSFRCAKCRDKGRLWVYHPKAYRPIREHRFVAARDLSDCVVACDACEAGEHEANRESDKCGKFKALPTFDEARMCLVTSSHLEEQIQELESFVSGADYRELEF